MSDATKANGRKLPPLNLSNFDIDPRGILRETQRPNKVPKPNPPVAQTLPQPTILPNPTLSDSNGNGFPAVIEVQAINGAVVPHTMVSNQPHVHTEDMTLSVSTKGLRSIITDCVKDKLFRRMKFFDKSKHASYSTSPQTVCGLVIKFCNMSSVQADHKWWDMMRSTVMKIHTDHRNNCIKAMRIKFQGTCAVMCACVATRSVVLTIRCFGSEYRIVDPKSSHRRSVSQSFAWWVKRAVHAGDEKQHDSLCPVN